MPEIPGEKPVQHGQSYTAGIADGFEILKIGFTVLGLVFVKKIRTGIGLVGGGQEGQVFHAAFAADGDRAVGRAGAYETCV